MIKYFLLVSTFKYYTKMPHYACAYTYTHMFECMCIHVYINFVSLLPSSSSTTGYVSWHPDQAVHGKTLLTKMLTCLPTLITKWDDHISNHFFLHDLCSSLELGVIFHYICLPCKHLYPTHWFHLPYCLEQILHHFIVEALSLNFYIFRPLPSCRHSWLWRYHICLQSISVCPLESVGHIVMFSMSSALWGKKVVSMRFYPNCYHPQWLGLLHRLQPPSGGGTKNFITSFTPQLIKAVNCDYYNMTTFTLDNMDSTFLVCQ